MGKNLSIFYLGLYLGLSCKCEQECHYSAKGGRKCVGEAVRVLFEAKKVLSELQARFFEAVSVL
jgi:hypothetical protein